METQRETLENWIDELQCALDIAPDGIVSAVLQDGQDVLYRLLYELLVSTGEIADYFKDV